MGEPCERSGTIWEFTCQTTYQPYALEVLVGAILSSISQVALKQDTDDFVTSARFGAEMKAYIPKARSYATQVAADIGSSSDADTQRV